MSRYASIENLREPVYRLRKGQFLNERHATQHVGLASSVAEYSQHPVIIEGVHPRLAAVPKQGVWRNPEPERHSHEP